MLLSMPIIKILRLLVAAKWQPPLSIGREHKESFVSKDAGSVVALMELPKADYPVAIKVCFTF